MAKWFHFFLAFIFATIFMMWTSALSNYEPLSLKISKLLLETAVIFPDCSMQAQSCFFSRNLFNEKLSYAFNEAKVLSVPNIYEMNDKRYEVLWLNYLRSLQLERYSLVIAASGSAEAILRYLETPIANMPEQLHDACRENLQRLQLVRFIIIDPPDIYTAGERHGRDFRISSINKHCCKNNLVIVSACVGRRHEVHNLASQLDVKVIEWVCDDDLFENQLLLSLH